jgi:hypothetical protein
LCGPPLKYKRPVSTAMSSIITSAIWRSRTLRHAARGRLRSPK